MEWHFEGKSNQQGFGGDAFGIDDLVFVEDELEVIDETAFDALSRHRPEVRP